MLQTKQEEQNEGTLWPAPRALSDSIRSAPSSGQGKMWERRKSFASLNNKGLIVGRPVDGRCWLPLSQMLISSAYQRPGLVPTNAKPAGDRRYCALDKELEQTTKNLDRLRVSHRGCKHPGLCHGYR